MKSYQEQILDKADSYCVTPTGNFKFKAYTDILKHVFAVTRLEKELRSAWDLQMTNEAMTTERGWKDTFHREEQVRIKGELDSILTKYGITY